MFLERINECYQILMFFHWILHWLDRDYYQDFFLRIVWSSLSIRSSDTDEGLLQLSTILYIQWGRVRYRQIGWFFIKYRRIPPYSRLESTFLHNPSSVRGVRTTPRPLHRLLMFFGHAGLSSFGSFDWEWHWLRKWRGFYWPSCTYIERCMC